MTDIAGDPDSERPGSRPSSSRPGAVMVAFWLLIAGAVLLLLGGLLTAATGFDTLRQDVPASVSDESLHSYLRLYRGVGVLFCVAAVVLAALAARARDGDPRFRRAVMAMGLALVVLVAIVDVVFGRSFIFALMSLLPIIAGVMVLNRPAVSDWFAGISLEENS